MTASGAGYWSAVLPAIATPGQLELFVEAVTEAGTEPLVATPGSPVVLPVVSPPGAPSRPLLATAALWADYAFYNSPSKANDRVAQTEGFVGMRFADEGIRAVRSGFGVYRGVGGSVAELDDPTNPRPPRSVGLTYGYLEAEFAHSKMLSFIGRGVLGLRDSGLGGGGQAFVRFGDDRKTNISLGGEVLGGIGVRGIAQLEWRTLPRIPVVLRTEVTNQPAGSGSSAPLPVSTPSTASTPSTKATGGGDIGARAIVQVGYQLTDHLELALRASYQGRTINHAGPGFGAGVTTTW